MFWDAFIQVLAIIGIIGVTAFVVVFVCDLILSVYDGRSGIFFKKKKKEKEEIVNERLETAEKSIELLKIQEMYRAQINNTEESQPAVLKSNAVDDAKAIEEEILLKQKMEMANFEPVVIEPEVIASEVIEQPVAPTITEKEDVLEKVKAELKNISDKVLDKFGSAVPTNTEKLSQYSDVLNQYGLDKLEQPIEIEEDDEDEEQLAAEQARIEEEKRLKEEQDRIAAEKLKEEAQIAMQDTEMLKQAADIEREKAEKLAQEIEELKAQLNTAIVSGAENQTIYTSIEVCEQRLLELTERLKAAKKDLKENNKEYKPLSRVYKNFEKYQDKLRRRYAMLAKKKMTFYGVNKYEDMDKEDADKLMQEMELVDGLKLSVKDCEAVIEANKNRYPVLEHNNKILTTNIKHIEADILEIETIIEKLRAE